MGGGKRNAGGSASGLKMRLEVIKLQVTSYKLQVKKVSVLYEAKRLHFASVIGVTFAFACKIPLARCIPLGVTGK